MKSLRLLLAVLYLSLVCDFSWSRDRLLERGDFLLAERAIERGDAAAYRTLAGALAEYPLFPYLEYQWLKSNLSQSDSIRAFLATDKDTRYAPLLREKWLKFLADQGRWQDYLDNYSAGNDISLECLYHWARFQSGFPGEALANAGRLWMSGSSQPQECEPLFQALARSGLLTGEKIWQRFELALTKNNRTLAEALAKQLPEVSQQREAELWLRVNKVPETVLEWNGRPMRGEVPPRLIAYGLERLAKSDPEAAVTLWDALKPGLQLPSADQAATERRLALALAYSRKSGAYVRLTALPGPDAEVREWRARAALFEQNWEHVEAALSGLMPDESREARWLYWRGRALAAAGREAEARAAFAEAAKDRSFYGYLAADTVSLPYRLDDRPVPVPASDLDRLAAEPAFQAVFELRALNRDLEAQRQWWFAVDALPREKHAAAAKLAEAWHWESVAIKTLIKADYWDDLGLRFPLRYLEPVRDNALRNRIDPAVVLGLIRQESMLDSRAESPVGALGLMQLMPKTGQQIAREIQESLAADDRLFDPNVNIRLGAYYFAKMLQRFGNHVAIAAAAYNAGPAKTAKWLPAAGTVPADIWIETIPYRETRKYVASVLFYAIVYQYRLGMNTLRIKDLLPAVPAG